MKTIKHTIILSFFLLFANTAFSQINVNVNLGAQPMWGPAGYERAEYYYLPDIEAYYYVPKKQFIYLNNGQWTFSSSLPPAYRGYDLYNGYKVVLNTPKPYLAFKEHKVKYAKFKNNRGQANIRAGKSNSANKRAHPNSQGKGKGNGKGKK